MFSLRDQQCQRRRSVRGSKRVLTSTAEERGVTNAQHLLLRDIVESPGHPIQASRIADIMRARGSKITDEEFATMTNAKATAGSSLMATLDIEFKYPGRKTPGAPRYIRWAGAPGAAHRGGLRNPPDALSISALHALQTTVDEYARVVRMRLEGRSMGGDKPWSATAEKEWTCDVLPLFLPPAGLAVISAGGPGCNHFDTLNHEFGGDMLAVGAASRQRAEWVLRRLRSLHSTGAVTVAGYKSGTVLEVWHHGTTPCTPSVQTKSRKNGTAVGKRPRSQSPTVGAVAESELETQMKEITNSNMPRDAKDRHLSILRRADADKQLHGRKMFDKGAAAGARQRLHAADSQAASKVRVLGAKGCRVSRRGMEDFERLHAHQPSCLTEAQLQLSGKKAEKPSKKYTAAQALLMPFVTEARTRPVSLAQCDRFPRCAMPRAVLCA